MLILLLLHLCYIKEGIIFGEGIIGEGIFGEGIIGERIIGEIILSEKEKEKATNKGL